jgi:hypothetical protein
MPRLRPASPSRGRGPKPDSRRALELLAASPDGCTEALMLAHGFTVELLVDLCIAELLPSAWSPVGARLRSCE